MTNLSNSYYVIEVPKQININEFMKFLEENQNVKSYFKITKEQADEARNGIEC